MFKKNILVLCLLAMNLYGMEENIRVDNGAHINVETMKLFIDKGDYKEQHLHNHNYPPKARYDKETPFFDKMKATLADGAWDALESAPNIIANILIQATTAILIQKTNSWLNGTSEGPSTEDKAMLKAFEQHQLEFIKLQMALKENKQAIDDFNEESLEFSDDQQESKKIQQTLQELKNDRKELLEKYRIFMKLSSAA